jgi:beta-galactosidase
MAFSRRNFLRSTAVGIALNWGGLRIFAGPASAPGANAWGQVAAPAKQFLYGTQFYRPPNPPRSERRQMLRTIAQEYQFNIIRVYPTWDYYNIEPEKFVFDEVEEVMKYCDEFGLRVLMGIVLETAPYWLEQAHPEARFVDAKGQPYRLQGSPAQITGGWPGLCLDWEPVRQAAARFIRELAKVVAPHSSLYAYDCWNEPHIEPAWARNIWAAPQEVLFCYCEKTIEEFQKWLERKYGSLDGLNEAWTRRYASWKAIDPPRSMGTYADWVDWRRFIIDRNTQEMKFRVETTRAVDPKHIMESHGAHHPPVDGAVTSATNGWRLGEVADVWGLSLFPRWQVPVMYHGAAKFDIARSNAAGKEFWLTELQGGHGNQGLWRSPKMRARDIRVWNWMAMATGAKAIIYWNYHAEATGREATGYGLVARSGAPTERSQEAAKNNRLIQEHWDIIRDWRPKPEVAILTDQDNALLTYAAAGHEGPSTSSFQGYYKALWNMDLWVDFLEPASLGKGNYRVLIVPWHLIGKKQTCEQLRHFVEGGGTLIVETGFGLFDERFYYNPVVPPYGLDQVFGYREGESYWVNSGTEAEPLIPPRNVPPSDWVYYEPEIEFTEPIAARVKASTYLTPLEVTTATPIGKYQDMTVAARKPVGRGQVYYFGTNLGASIAAGNDNGIELLRAIVTRIVQPPVTSDKVRPRLIPGEKRGLLVVFNDQTEDRTGFIRLPPNYTRATDLHRPAPVPIEQNGVRITVPYQDVAVLLLE